MIYISDFEPENPQSFIMKIKNSRLPPEFLNVIIYSYPFYKQYKKIVRRAPWISRSLQVQSTEAPLNFQSTGLQIVGKAQSKARATRHDLNDSNRLRAQRCQYFMKLSFEQRIINDMVYRWLQLRWYIGIIIPCMVGLAPGSLCRHCRTRPLDIPFLFIFTTKRREWVCSSNYGAAEKTKKGKQLQSKRHRDR